MSVDTPAPSIQAIETSYAGCRFRSRLEARWAVFFDHLGIAWRYEQEGYELPSGRYLPDFVIKASQLGNNGEIFVEVKGMLDAKQHVRLIRAALELPPISRYGPPFPQMLVLGNVPRPGSAWTHSRIEVGVDTFAVRDVFFTRASGLEPFGEAIPFRKEWLVYMEEDDDSAARQLLNPAIADRVAVDPVVDGAYRAARSARFEFGESG